MFSFLANRSLSFKLALVCGIPVLALFAISAHDILSAYRAWQKAQAVERVLNIAPHVSNVVYHLQRERGTSAGYIGSRGTAFGDRLAAVRSATDTHLADLSTRIAYPGRPFDGVNFEGPYRRALLGLEQIDTVRNDIDSGNIDVDRLTLYYTQIISSFLESIENIKFAAAGADATRPISAYIALMRAKELAGLERAMGVVGFGSGQFLSETYERYLSLIAKQEHLLSTVTSHAPSETLVAMNQLQGSPIEQQVRAYRDVAGAAPFGGSITHVSAPDWWAAATARIDALKDIEQRLSQTLRAQAQNETREALSGLGLLAATLSGLVLGAAIVSFWVYREIQPPIARIIASMRAWAKDDTVTDLVEAERGDGIGELARTFNDLRHRLEENRVIENERTARERAQTMEMKLLSDLNEWLQSSTSTDELYEMIGTFMTRMLPDCSGSVYVYSNSRDVLCGTCAWNGGELLEHIRADDCWALRRGRGYSFRTQEIKFACEHTKPHDDSPYFCLPILAHGETVGMMHLTPYGDVCEEDFFDNYQIAQLAAEQISLAIANSKMRDQLHQQSIRDPLTGLYNRRHFVESLRLQVEMSKRRQTPFILASIDVDHFKRFNDNHGHDAGDMVLRAVGATLEQECDGDELPCRIGGEEFMLLLPETDVDQGRQRTEHVRQAIERISVRYGEKTLPKITISIGLSVYPDHGANPQELMRTADNALYKSKANGRNQVTVASLSLETGDAAPSARDDAPANISALKQELAARADELTGTR